MTPTKSARQIAEDLAMKHGHSVELEQDIQQALTSFADERVKELEAKLSRMERVVEAAGEVLKAPKHDETDAPYTKVVLHDTTYEDLRKALAALDEGEKP
jgi:hypothetical protein